MDIITHVQLMLRKPPDLRMLSFHRNEEAWSAVLEHVRPTLAWFLMNEDFEGMAVYWERIGRAVVTEATKYNGD